jgi:predicted ribosomally synthesized peptide with SipW-like signal peptide
MNKSASRKALIASAAAVSLSALLFAGTTYAWFTDSASSGTSTIQSGNLDVNLYKLVEKADTSAEAAEGATVLDYEAVTAKSLVFAESKTWEPGAVEVQYLKVENAGTLALEYNLTVDVIDNVYGKTADDKDIDLTKYLKAAILPVEQLKKYESREAALTAASAAVDLADLQSYGTELSAAEGRNAAYLAVIVYMPETVGNEANHNGNKAPQISLQVNVEAKQSVYENDSFGNTYDTDSTYDGAIKVGSGEITNDNLVTPVVLTENAEFKASSAESVVIDLNDKSLTGDSDATRNCVISGTNPTLILKNGTYINGAPEHEDGDFLLMDENAENITVSAENVTFKANTAGEDYSLLLSCVGTNGTITFKNCTFENVGLGFGALAANKSTDQLNITFENCTFITSVNNVVTNVFKGGSASVTFKNCSYSADDTTIVPVTESNYYKFAGATGSSDPVTFTVINEG